MPSAADPAATGPIPTENSACALCGETASHEVARGRDTIYWSSDDVFTFVECEACGHLYLNPRPTIAALDRIYPQDYATFSRRFSRSDAWIAKIKDRILLRRFRALGLELPDDATILDVGCGDGAFLSSLRSAHPDWRLIGLDWHFPDATRRTLEARGIELVEGAVETAPLPCEIVDLVNMNQLIEHVWDPIAVLARCWKALRPGGWLALETPNPEGYDRRWFSKGTWGAYYYPRHLNLFAPEALERLTRAAQFEPVRRFDLLAPPCWVYTVMAVNRSRSRPIRWIEAFFKDTNPLALAPFAVLDGISRLLGRPTSNQKLLARRPAASG